MYCQFDSDPRYHAPIQGEALVSYASNLGSNPSGATRGRRPARSRISEFQSEDMGSNPVVPTRVLRLEAKAVVLHATYRRFESYSAHQKE